MKRSNWRALLGISIAAGSFAAMKAYDQSQKQQQVQQQKLEEPAPSSGGVLLGAYQSDFDIQALDRVQRPTGAAK